MTGHASTLYAVFLCGADTVCVIEEAHQSNDLWRSFKVEVNGRATGERREIPMGYAPRLAIHAPLVFFWASDRVWWSSLHESGSEGMQVFSEDVVAVYRLRDHWVVVTELGAVVLDGAFERRIRQFSIDEVVVHHRWSGDVLSLEDLQGRVIDIDL